jgi:hypothetical protein
MRTVLLFTTFLAGCANAKVQVSASYQISPDAKIEATLISLESRPSRVVIVEQAD